MKKWTAKDTNEALGAMPGWIHGMTPEQLAKLPLESNHNSWDGYERRDLPAFARMAADLKLYVEGCIEWPKGGEPKDHAHSCCWGR